MSSSEFTGQDKTPPGDSDALLKEVDALRARVAHCEQTEKLLRQKEAAIEAVLDSAVDGILAVDENGGVLFSNRQFARMWRIPPDLVEAGDDNELLQFVLDQLADPEEFLSKVRELYKSPRQSLDILHFRDGRIFERYSLPLVIDDRPCGRVWTFRDVTRLRQAMQKAAAQPG